MDAKMPPISTTKRTRYEMVPAIKGPGILMVSKQFFVLRVLPCCSLLVFLYAGVGHSKASEKRLFENTETNASVSLKAKTAPAVARSEISTLSRTRDDSTCTSSIYYSICHTVHGPRQQQCVPVAKHCGNKNTFLNFRCLLCQYNCRYSVLF
jgi:hypothetical protein